LGVPVAHSQDATTVLVSVGCTGALFFLLRPLIGFVPALLAVALWTASPLALHCATGVAPPQTYLLSAALAWFGAGLAVRGHWIWATMAFALAVIERGETSLALGAAAAVGWFVMPADRRRPVLLLLGVSFAGFAFHQLYAPSKERTWLAFRQHYAGGAVLRGDGAPNADFGNPDATVQRDFGAADSLASAARANPGALASHAVSNLVQLPGVACQVVVTPFGQEPVLRWAIVAALGSALVWTMTRGRRRARRSFRARRWILAALGAGALAAMVVPVLLLPRCSFLTAVVPFAMTCLGLVLRGAIPRRLNASWVLAAGAVVLFVVPLPFADGHVHLREVRATVRLLQRCDLRPGDALCGDYHSPMICFARHSEGGRCVSFDALARPTPEESGTAFRAFAPDLLMVSASTIPEAGPMGVFLASELATDRWEIVDYSPPMLLFRRVP
jgi:hypothetical protein